ncbi:MAG: hypothetical protein ACE5NC_04640 [Anaerolineae bacterium]
MDRLSALTTGVDRRVALAVGAAFGIGLIVGWLGIGWWLWPVTYFDTDPPDLRRSHQEAYLSMVADSYHLTGDAALAEVRLQGFDAGEVEEILSEMMLRQEAAGDLPAAQRLRELAAAFGLEQPAPGAAVETPTPDEEPASAEARSPSGASLLRTILTIGGVFVLVGAAVAGVGVGLSRWQGRRQAPPQRRLEEVLGTPGLSWEEAPAASLGHFETTYRFGDDGYDTSFNIETPAGEFYGACGIGFSEVIAEGPDKITAFEIWLFDRTDPENVQTVTAVLMSEHAYYDEALREKTRDRGEAVLAESGREITVSGTGLVLTARVSEFEYGQPTGVPRNSYFERLTTELTPRLRV